MNTTSTRERYERAEREFDLESWGRPTAEQLDRYEKFGPRHTVHQDDPLPEVPYEERTVRQVIYTFSKVNPAWSAEVAHRSSPFALARTLAFVAHERGFGLRDVMGRAEANRLERSLIEYVAFSRDSDPPAVHDLTRDQRAVWFAWLERVLALPPEDRWSELPPFLDGAS